ncbi:hypothetical protein LguiA_032186 [Lonicera macranthoides]
MIGMKIDLPKEPANSLPPKFRIVQRLALIGVPEENFEQLQPGLIAYVKDNKSRVPEIVSAILPSDEDAMEAVLESQSESVKPLGIPNLEDQFRESMIWLQWLMFNEEPNAALKHLAAMSAGQRGVCGAVWGNNDIAYRCRTCQHDPTCAICVPCFLNGTHKDHDYSIIYTGGGCCDCGDVTAWKREGFCSKHKGAEQIQPLPDEFAISMGPVLDSLFLVWKKKLGFVETLSQEASGVAGYKKFADELSSSVVEMLLDFCKYSESLLSFVSGRVLESVGLLDVLVRAERFLDDDVRKLQELLLKLLGEPLFKYEFAKVFLKYYQTVVNDAIKECNDSVLKKYPLLSTFSVQIFTVPTLTPRLVKEMNLLTILLDCLGNIFVFCDGEDGRLQVNKWGNLYETTIRVVEDIRFVMSHSVVPKYVIRDRRDILRTWMKLLASVQGMNPQKRETGIHIEEENENNMNLPFVLVHSIANIHSLLVNGAFSSSSSEEMDYEAFSNTCKQDFEDQDSLRHAKVGRLSQESSVCGVVTGRSGPLDCISKASEVKSGILPIPTSVSSLTFECLRAIENLLGVDNASGLLSVLSPKTGNIPSNNFFALKRTLSKFRKGRYIFKSYNETSSNTKHTSSSSENHGKQISSPSHGSVQSGGVDMETGKDMDCDSPVEGEYANELEALRVLSLSDWPDITYDVSSEEISVHIPLHRLLSSVLQRALRRCYDESVSLNPSLAISTDFFGHVLGGCHPYGFSAFVMEHPLRVRVFCAEVHAGMWRKNGDAPIVSYDWYHSVRWSEQGLELDLFLLQCCAALAPTDLYVNRILERFGLSNYLSLSLERSSEYEPFLMQEMLSLIIQIVKERRFCGLTTSECLRRELIYKLCTGDATHSQLVKSLPRDLSKLDQLQEILDTIAAYSNPSGMNQGMYKLRLSYWKELDLYHPRWNSRDLQVVEERYMRFCNVSALTSQLPKWAKVYHPFKGLARLATCKTVLQIIRAVLFYAVFTDKMAASRSPDVVILAALHLLSLSLDVCYVHKESGDRSCYVGDVIPVLAFAGEEIRTGISNNRSDGQSLLSLLVSLMKKHRNENPASFLESGNFHLSSLIENLLKKFAELDSGCMANLRQLAPEVVNHLLPSIPYSDANIMGTASDADNRKAKARERQAAIMEKMRAQQSRFLASIKSTSDDGSDSSKFDQEVHSDDSGHDSKESGQVICSLCHDPHSKYPLSYLVLLQKSRLLGLVDRGPPSWENGHQSEKNISTCTHTKGVPSRANTVPSISELIPSSQLTHLIQNAVNEFASDGQPREVNSFLDFIKARFPSVGNIQLPCTSNDSRERFSASLETSEERMYLLIRGGMQDQPLDPDLAENFKKYSTGGDGSIRSGDAESLLLGKYIAALSKETLDNPSASGSARSRNDKARSKSSMPIAAYDGFGPSDCDGIHLSSCGHAVHQGCLDRYLSSLKERYIRRIVFEGGHIVDPDQGEFLCPVCRGLVNSVLPALRGDPRKSAGQLVSSNRTVDSLRLQQGLSLLRSAADITGRNEILKTFPMQRNARIRPDLESVFRVLCGMYFPGKENISGSGRVSHSMIMWDTLKYSLISTEIAARSGRDSLTPNYGLNSLYKELKSPSGFILSLLIKIVQSTRTKNSLTLLLRLRGIQLFAKSICSGLSLDEFPSCTYRRGGNMLCILENAEMEVRYPDIQFWARASDPVLARDAFSSLMWILFCLPGPFLSCKESFFSLVHIFYVVSVTQAIIIYLGKRESNISELGFHDSLITDILKFTGVYGFVQQYFVSNYVDPSSDIKDTIRKLSFSYLRRCALLWNLINSSTCTPYSDGAHVHDQSSHALDDRMEYVSGSLEELAEIEELEKMFKIPSLDVVLNDDGLRSLVSKWLLHFSKEFEVRFHQSVLHSTPVIPFKLMILPHLYQDLLQRYIKQHCPDCGAVQEEPALCLLCGKLCSPNWKTCCRKNGCQTHATACGAGTGVFLLIRKTTILLQRSARQAPWPSLYLDAYGEEDIEMHRGKPLHLNEERYAALTHMVASHGLDRSSKVLRQTNIGAFFML